MGSKPQYQGNVVRLAERRPNREIVEQLQDLLNDAAAGRIAGAIVAVHYGGAEYGYLGSGTMCSDPTRGIAAAHRLATKLLHHNI